MGEMLGAAPFQVRTHPGVEIFTPHPIPDPSP